YKCSRFGQICNEVRLDIKPNKEIDVHSQVTTHKQRIRQLEKEIGSLMDTCTKAQATIAELESKIVALTTVDETISEEEQTVIDAYIKAVLSGEPIKENWSQQLQMLRKAGLIHIIDQMQKSLAVQPVQQDK